MRAGNAQALEDLIRSASEARGAWQIGGSRGPAGGTGGSGNSGSSGA